MLKQYKLLGLDINTSYIRWVQIYHTPDQMPLINSYGAIALEEKQSNFTQMLKSLILKHSLSKSVIGVALPDANVQKITLTLDANLSIIQLKKTFKEVAASLFNQSIKEVHYQYQVLGFAKNHSAQLNFLLIAVQKQVIESLLARLKASYLTPKLIDVESFAVERGQEALNNHRIMLEKNLNADDFIKQSEHLKLSLGLTMHPELKNCWSFLW